MSLVRFEKTVLPCVMNDVTAWHVAHGWIWDVVEVASRRLLGVFFCTLLCGDGCVIHFEPRPGEIIRWPLTLAAFRKAVRMISPVCDVVYATVPADKIKLIHTLLRLGFVPVENGGFRSDGREILLLKFFG